MQFRLDRQRCIRSPAVRVFMAVRGRMGVVSKGSGEKLSSHYTLWCQLDRPWREFSPHPAIMLYATLLEQDTSHTTTGNHVQNSGTSVYFILVNILVLQHLGRMFQFHHRDLPTERRRQEACQRKRRLMKRWMSSWASAGESRWDEGKLIEREMERKGLELLWQCLRRTLFIANKNCITIRETIKYSDYLVNEQCQKYATSITT